MPNLENILLLFQNESTSLSNEFDSHENEPAHGRYFLWMVSHEETKGNCLGAKTFLTLALNVV